MKFLIKNLSIIQTGLQEKQFYIFYPSLKDYITTELHTYEFQKIQLPFMGWIQLNSFIPKYSYVIKTEKPYRNSKLSFTHFILYCRLSFQVKALPKFAKKDLKILLINKTIKQWGYQAYLEGGPHVFLKKPPFLSKLWQNLQYKLNIDKIQQIKVFPLYAGWRQTSLTPYFFTKKKRNLFLVFGLQASLIQKPIKENSLFLTRLKFKSKKIHTYSNTKINELKRKSMIKFYYNLI